MILLLLYFSDIFSYTVVRQFSAPTVCPVFPPKYLPQQALSIILLLLINLWLLNHYTYLNCSYFFLLIFLILPYDFFVQIILYAVGFFLIYDNKIERSFNVEYAYLQSRPWGFMKFVSVICSYFAILFIYCT